MSPLLALSIAALLVGPFAYRGARSRAAVAAVDAFALVAVAGLVFAHILPQSFQLAGWLVVPLAVLGMFGPGLLCGSRLFRGRESRAIALPLALLAIGLHALLDGVAIASGEGGGEGARELALAVVIHRVPDGLGIWWLVRPLYGVRAALLLLFGIALFSVLGFNFGGAVLSATPAEVIALVQAVLAGSLLHVVLRHPPTATGEEPERRWHAASALGGLLAVALVLGLGRLHAHADEAGSGVGAGFLSLALESAPALLMAYLVVGVAHVFVLDLFKLLRRGSPLGQALRGTLVGLPVSVCSCGVIPLYRSLVVGGVPATASMAFLIATPELELGAIVLSLSLLGPEITVARVLAAFALALLVGRIAGARADPVADAAPPPPAERPPLARRLVDGMRYGLGDMVDGTAPWILVGIALAAALEPLLDPRSFAALPQLLEIPLFALIGMPLYVCASGSTPLVAVLLAKGVSPGAAIAFLLTGPATNLTTFGALRRMHSTRVAVAFVALALVTTFALGNGVDQFLAGRANITASDAEHEHGWFSWACASILGLLTLWVLFRGGPRAFLSQLWSLDPGDQHHHAHEEQPRALP